MQQKFVLSSVAVTLALASRALALYGDPPDAQHAWAVHDRNRPTPPVIAPGTASTPDRPGKAPSDAIVLFDGSSTDEWVSDKDGGPTKWIVRDGAFECVKNSGYVKTKREFADCQLHVEFATPKEVSGSDQGRGNSGVFLMGLYEVQVLDCYNNVTYADGQTASIYSQNPPLVNACRAPGEWQSYDIVFHPPVIRDGKVSKPGSITVFHNGVLVQDHWLLEGPTGHRGRSKLNAHPARMALKLQDHGNPVRFRNIWVREIPTRAEQQALGGFESDPAAVQAKQAGLAKKFREEAAGAKGFEAVNKYLESLQYQKDDATQKALEAACNEFLAPLKAGGKAAVESKKGELESMFGGFRLLGDFGILPKDFGPRAAVEQIGREHDLPFAKKR